MQDFERIFSGYSTERMLTYKNFIKLELKIEEYTPENIYHFYNWSDLISSAFWQVISKIEVLLRNRINDVLKNNIDKNWFDLNKNNQTGIFFSKYHAESIEKALGNIRRKQKIVNNGRVVSELNMGFWTDFLDISFSNSSNQSTKQIGWQYFIPEILPGYKYGNKDPHRYWNNEKNKQKLKEKLNDIKEIRNRIAHHEPIFKYMSIKTRELSKDKRGGYFISLQRNYLEALELLHWLSPELSKAYQKSYANQYAQYIITESTFHHMVLEANELDDIFLLERYIEYLMEYMDDPQKENNKILYISNKGGQFGCFIPYLIK